MIEAKPGTVLANAYNIGDRVLASVVVDALVVSISPDPPTRHIGSGEFCPVCEREVRIVTRAYCILHNMNCTCFYCSDCWLLYHNIEIGTLDSEGDFHPYAEN